MIRFKETVCNLGAAANYVDDKISVNWDFVSTSSNISTEIQSVTPECTCTAELKFSKLESISNTNTFKGSLMGTFTKNKDDKGIVKKAINVYLNDGQDILIENEFGGKQHNPAKLKYTLYIIIDYGV